MTIRDSLQNVAQAIEELQNKLSKKESGFNNTN